MLDYVPRSNGYPDETDPSCPCKSSENKDDVPFEQHLKSMWRASGCFEQTTVTD